MFVGFHVSKNGRTLPNALIEEITKYNITSAQVFIMGPQNAKDTINDVDKVAIKNIEPKIIASIKKESEFQFFRKAQTTINYNYKDRNGQFVFKIVITPEKYK